MAVLLVLILLALLWPSFVRGIFGLVAVVALGVVGFVTIAQRPAEAPGDIASAASSQATRTDTRIAQAQPLAATGKPFVVTMETSVSGGVYPTITGTTNLPDGTQLSVQLWKPRLPDIRERMAALLPTCEGYCMLIADRDDVVVRNGHFKIGPFKDAPFRLGLGADWDAGRPAKPGEYTLEISNVLGSPPQPPEVAAILGRLGENATGPFIGGCCFDTLWSAAEVKDELEKNRRDATSVGASLYYARHINIGR
jgi:hypothetical protein